VGAKSKGPDFDRTNSGHYDKLILTRLFGELTEKEKMLDNPL